MPSYPSNRSGQDHNRPAGKTAEAKIAKALAHPLRARILQRLGERVASRTDLAVRARRAARRHQLSVSSRAHGARARCRAALRKHLSPQTLQALIYHLAAAGDAGHFE